MPQFAMFTISGATEPRNVARAIKRLYKDPKPRWEQFSNAHISGTLTKNENGNFVRGFVLTMTAEFGDETLSDAEVFSRLLQRGGEIYTPLTVMTNVLPSAPITIIPPARVHKTRPAANQRRGRKKDVGGRFIKAQGSPSSSLTPHPDYSVTLPRGRVEQGE